MRNLLLIISAILLQSCIGFTRENCTLLTGWCKERIISLKDGWYIKDSDNFSNIAYEKKVNKDLYECKVTDRYKKSQDPIVNKCMEARGWIWRIWKKGK